MLRDDPVKFSKVVLGVKYLTPDQKRFMRAVAAHRRVVCTSGHGVGKDFASACLVLWFLYTHKGCRVITTAATEDQVLNVLWREIGALWHRARADGFDLNGRLTSGQLEIETKWFAQGLSTNDGNRFHGKHGQAVMVLLDEADGVARNIWDASEGLAVGPDDRLVAIGNPLTVASRFEEVCASGLWHHEVISSEDHPNVRDNVVYLPGCATREWVNERLAEYGSRESPEYMGRVRGLWPKEFGRYFARWDGATYPLGSIKHPYWFSRILSCDWGYKHDAAIHLGVTDGESIWIEREVVVNLREPRDLARDIWQLACTIPPQARIDAFYLSPDAWAQEDGPRSTASELRKALAELALERLPDGRTIEIPPPRQAFNSRISGWQLVRSHLYDRRLQISDHCPGAVRFLKQARYDPKKHEDVQKYDKDNEGDSIRYMVASWLTSPTIPVAELIARATRDRHARAVELEAAGDVEKAKTEILTALYGPNGYHATVKRLAQETRPFQPYRRRRSRAA